ncbi:MAG: MFS transporter [Acidimicrobiales bacterium]
MRPSSADEPDQAPRPPDSGWTRADRRALTSIAVQFWVNGAVASSYLPRLPEIRDGIGVTNAGLGLLLSLGVIGGLAGSAVCGRVIERVGTRAAMAGGTAAGALLLPLLGVAPSWPLFLAALAGLQLSDVVADVAMNLVGSRLSARRPVPVMNRLHGLWSAGALMGGTVSTVAAGRVDLRVHLTVMAAFLLLVLVYVYRGLPARDTPAPPPRRSTSRLNRMAVLFMLVGMAATIVEDVPGDWAAIHLADDLGAHRSVAGTGFVAVAAGMVAGRMAGDHLTQWLGAQRLTRLAFLVAAAGAMLGSLSPSVGLSLGGFVIAGIGSAVILPRLYDDAATAPGRPGGVLGGMLAGSRLGVLIAPITVGALSAAEALSVGESLALVVGLATLGGLATYTRLCATNPR